MSERDGVLDDVLRKMDKCMLDFSYLELAQDIWDASWEMVAQEDKVFREYLQWLEGNLDTLVHIDAPCDALNSFLSKQRDLLRMAMRDVNVLESAHWEGAIEYVEGKNSSQA